MQRLLLRSKVLILVSYVTVVAAISLIARWQLVS